MTTRSCPTGCHLWLGHPADISHWVEVAIRQAVTMDESTSPLGVSVLMTNIEGITQLNRDFRQKDQPTNVLSFPLEAMAEGNRLLLGDIAIALPVVEQEALDQQKPAIAHLAHLVVHGVLHLMGYDHIETQDAEEMEPMEIKILAELGFPNPYESPTG